MRFPEIHNSIKKHSSFTNWKSNIRNWSLRTKGSNK